MTSNYVAVIIRTANYNLKLKFVEAVYITAWCSYVCC